MKKIKFFSIDINLEFIKPVPASKMIPEWYRNIPGVIDGIETVKKCMPFLDGMTNGYMILLPADIYIENGNIQQITNDSFVETHSESQVTGIQIPKEFSSKPYKWINPFVIKTPRGYSTMFVHPANRVDLPFYTITGVVETDKFDLPVNFPFFVRKDFTGIIKAGTPVAQVFPFKRQDWEHEIEDRKQFKLPLYRFTMHNPPLGFYKKYFWQRKLFK